VRLMYDSVDAAALPASAQMVAGYANGRYPSYEAIKQRFPRIPVIGIGVFGSALHHPAHVLDIENGDATPEEFGPWARAMRLMDVRRPTAYIGKARLIELLHHRRRGQILDVWVADWTGDHHELAAVGANVVAVQFAAPGHGSPGEYDVSAVYDDSWHPG
jgi:hypothetical protein